MTFRLAAAREKKGVLDDISGALDLEEDEPTSCSDNEHSLSITHTHTETTE